MKTRSIALFAILLSLATAGVANETRDHRAPEVPQSLEVSSDYRVSFHAYAVGVQIYRGTVSPTDPTKLVWTFTGPEAVLYDADDAIVGTHYAYAGPSLPGWESNSGSVVVCMRAALPVPVPGAIPWLLLAAVDAKGPGIFNHTAFIQRVNTTGGLPPATPPLAIGEEARVPYTAEYFFYRKRR